MENKKETPGYYAIIPAPVRYCKKLESKAGYLYGEITALSNKEGYCWATNGYFSELYSVHKNTISSWIQSLKKEGFIKVKEIRIENGSFQRRISINENTYPHQRKHVPPSIETLNPLNENSEHNNTSNNTINNTSNTDFPKNGKSDFNNLNDFSIKEEKKERENSAKKKVITYPFNDQDFLDAWNLWKQYKKEQFRFTYKGTISEQTALKQLADKSDNNKSIAISIIQASMANSYMGLFRPNKNENQKDRGNSVSTDAELSAALDLRYGRSEQSVFDSADN